ncbi:MULTISPECIES: YbaL family putative K(+) efflux transporter [Inquilinus]|uniref:CPA2 family monovalent cation:H+ antiporter-2 n=1 Tax=Inquilinus ginsengisoli TaxID=363840 RepID=A0ABU1JRJ6_9PROT|nr:YbaL family putative K(+) efflux transporter [Inquilinus ginsengisoli]MDR6290205.1 CPA2 family monovalent cation:H+ antiporter-2 [Inquilinus ginsengisoli]
MPHDTPLIATIVAGLGLAFIFGAIAHRLKAPPLVGYLLAGILVGPHTPGFVADQALAPELAEIGVILLMFGVGLHFSLKDLLSVRAIAVPGAVVQIAFATALGLGLALWLGWTVAGGLVFGLALSVASTVVLLRALQERRLVETERGRIAVGWLIVEDLAMVLALVLLPALAGLVNGGGEVVATDPIAAYFDLGIGGVLGLTLLKVAAFVALMLVVGRRVIPWVLHYTAHTGSRELFRLAVLAIALGVAFGSAKLFGVSLALGAFFAGMILGESKLSHAAAQETLPLRDAFAVLFFVSVGMLFDPASLLRDPLPMLAVVFIIVIGKSVAAFVIVRVFRHPVGTALLISASLAQIGEFSFILAELGVQTGLLPEAGRDLILGGAILSILLNPVVFTAFGRLRPMLERPAPAVAEPSVAAEPVPDAVEAATLAEPAVPTALAGHAVLVGYGRVGSLVGAALQAQGRPFLVIEDADQPVARLQEEGVETIIGNAASPEILGLANLAGARQLVVAVPNAFEAGQIVAQGRAANPGLAIIARAHSDAEVEHLTGLGADTVIMGEREIARGMAEALAAQPDPRPEEAVAG